MNPTIVYHGAWLVFGLLAIAMGMVELIEGLSTFRAALLLVVGLLFGGRSVHALFVADETDEVSPGRMYLAVAVLLVFLLVLGNQYVL